jgi:DNA polymerase III epsilon subunit-like protein
MIRSSFRTLAYTRIKMEDPKITISEQPKKKIKISSAKREKEQVILFFDLETNGKRPFYQSAIMQLGLYDSRENGADGNIKRSAIQNFYVRPYDGIVGATEIHGISAETLEKEKAITSAQMLEHLVATYPASSKKEYIFVAFNNFGFDQNVLEYHFHHHGISVPGNWIFADIFPYISQYYPKLRADGGYKLENCYKKICCTSAGGEGEEEIDFHTATDDVYCLARLYYKVIGTATEKKRFQNAFMRGSYTCGTIVQSPVSTIAGYANFFKLEEKGMASVGDLYAKFQELGGSSDAFRNFIKEKMGIYSSFYQGKIVEQFEIIHHLMAVSDK